MIVLSGRAGEADRVRSFARGADDLIVAFDLTNEGNDLQQLHPMAAQGKAAVGADQVSVVADTGYSNGAHGRQCEQDGIKAIVPRAERVNPKGKQYFSRDQFSYDRDSDSWNCPDLADQTEKGISDTGLPGLSAEVAMHRGGAAGHRTRFP